MSGLGQAAPTSGQALAAAVLFSIAIYVYFHGSTEPVPVFARISRDISTGPELQEAVEGVLSRRLGITPVAVADGKLFLATNPPEDEDEGALPDRSTSVRVKATSTFNITDNKCILLDLKQGVPGAAAPAAGGGASVELLEAIRAMPAQLAAAMNPPDVESIMSDRVYERFARGQLFGMLVDRCGLEVVRGTTLDRRTLMQMQWDFRAAVRCAATRGDPRNVEGTFEAFLSEEGYIRPPSIPTRIVTPTKFAGASEPPAAEYLAVFEITTASQWTRGARSMLPRLNTRLVKSLLRAKEQGILRQEQCITDLVAVVGVASTHECSDSVCALMDVEVPPGELHPYAELKAMMDVGRFVFIHVPKAGSPTASSAGRDGSPPAHQPVGVPAASARQGPAAAPARQQAGGSSAAAAAALFAAADTGPATAGVSPVVHQPVGTAGGSAAPGGRGHRRR